MTEIVNRESYTLQRAEKHCLETAGHYENFTVGSLLFPRAMRQDLANFYAFCRGADDISDEGDTMTPEGRGQALNRLSEWEAELEHCYSGEPSHPVFIALRSTIRRRNLPPEPFRDLLSAFQQDQRKQRYETFDELLDYCRRSANPVGRIYLMMFGLGNAELFALSDAICAALQLTNFWQDVRRDIDKGRIYIPLEDMERFQYSEGELKSGIFNSNFRRLMEFEVERTQEFFDRGRKLERLVKPKVALELRLFRRGGESILRRIKSQDYNVFENRPALNRRAKAWIFITSLVTIGFGFGRGT